MNLLSIPSQVAQSDTVVQQRLRDWQSLSADQKKAAKALFLNSAYRPGLSLQVLIAIFCTLYSSKYSVLDTEENLEVAGTLLGATLEYLGTRGLQRYMRVTNIAHPFEEAAIAAVCGYAMTQHLLKSDTTLRYATKYRALIQSYNLYILGVYGLPIFFRLVASGQFDKYYKPQGI